MKVYVLTSDWENDQLHECYAYGSDFNGVYETYEKAEKAIEGIANEIFEDHSDADYDFEFIRKIIDGKYNVGYPDATLTYNGLRGLTTKNFYIEETEVI